MTKLVHKSVYNEPEVWQRLKINAELSDLTLRDYLRQLIMDSSPLDSTSVDRPGATPEASSSDG